MSHTKIALPFIFLAVIVAVSFAYDGGYGGGGYGSGGYGAGGYGGGGYGKRDAYGSYGGGDYGSSYGGSRYGRAAKSSTDDQKDKDKPKDTSSSDSAKSSKIEADSDTRAGRGKRESEHGGGSEHSMGKRNTMGMGMGSMGMGGSGHMMGKRNTMGMGMGSGMGMGGSSHMMGKRNTMGMGGMGMGGMGMGGSGHMMGKRETKTDDKQDDASATRQGRDAYGYGGNSYGNPSYSGNYGSGYGGPSNYGGYGRKRRDVSAAQQGQIPQAKFTPVRGPKQFSVNVADGIQGANQLRKEKWDNGTMTGMYANPLGNGKYQVIEYIADDKGYRILSTKIVDESELSADKFNPLAGKKEAQVEINNDGTTTSYTVTPDQIAKKKMQKGSTTESVDQSIDDSPKAQSG